MRTRNESVIKNTALKYLVYLILLFSLTTLCQSLFDRVSINKLLGALIAVLSGTVFLMQPKRGNFFRFCILLIDAYFSFIASINLSKDINDWIFFFTTILVLMVLADPSNRACLKKTIYKNKKLIKWLVHIECLILAVLLITRTGYTYHWGEGGFFVGLCNSQHTLASLCCLLLSMILMVCVIQKNTKLWYGVLMLIPSFGILESGARVFLFPMAILLVLYIQYTIKKPLLRIIIYIFGIVCGLAVILRSNMAEKFAFVANNQYATNAFSSFTSGRSEFWAVDLKYYFTGNIFQLLFGRSFSEVYAINLKEVRLEIWSHNDLIHLLNGAGLIGTMLYLMILKDVFREIRSAIRSNLQYIMLLAYVFLPMLLNGFFPYQHYLYSFFILFFILMIKKENENE